MNRDATPDYPIHELFIRRHSPYAFDPVKTVAVETVNALFEAARWTMSSYNAQPWRYIVGIRDVGIGDVGTRNGRTGDDGSTTWQKILDCLLEGNQPWAQNAPVLALGLTKTTFDHNGKPNRAAEHDLGAASAFLTLEAVSRGLCVHQMIGIDPDKVIKTFAPAAGIIPLTGLAIGYRGTPEHIPQAYAERDQKPRMRLARSDILL
jgi:nitroreductase